MKIKIIQGTGPDLQKALKECGFFKIGGYDGIKLKAITPIICIASNDINAEINLNYNGCNIKKGASFEISLTKDFENKEFFVKFKILEINRGD